MKIKKVITVCITILLLFTFACTKTDGKALNVSFDGVSAFMDKFEIKDNIPVFDGLHQNMTKEDILKVLNEKGYQVFDEGHAIAAYPENAMEYSFDIQLGDVKFIIACDTVDLSKLATNEERSKAYKEQYDKTYSALAEKLGEPFITENVGYSVISTWVIDNAGNILKGITPEDKDAWYQLMNDDISFIRLQAEKDDYTGTPPVDSINPEWGSVPYQYMEFEPIEVMFGEGQWFKNDIDAYYKYRAE